MTKWEQFLGCVGLSMKAGMPEKLGPKKMGLKRESERVVMYGEVK